ATRSRMESRVSRTTRGIEAILGRPDYERPRCPPPCGARLPPEDDGAWDKRGGAAWLCTKGPPWLCTKGPPWLCTYGWTCGGRGAGWKDVPAMRFWFCIRTAGEGWRCACWRATNCRLCCCCM